MHTGVFKEYDWHGRKLALQYWEQMKNEKLSKNTGKNDKKKVDQKRVVRIQSEENPKKKKMKHMWFSSLYYKKAPLR